MGRVTVSIRDCFALKSLKIPRDPGVLRTKSSKLMLEIPCLAHFSHS
jgi:hypothetical protein